MATGNVLSPIIDDVQTQYVKHRRTGKSRTTAIELIHEEYIHELQDVDDSLAVLIGLSLALCKKKELLEPVAAETLDQIQRALQSNDLNSAIYTYLTEVEQKLMDTAVYGNEASYRRISTYTPDWKIGDTFSHKLTYPTAEALGIKGWFILLHKVGEYADEFEAPLQLMYVSLCPPHQVPSCYNELEKLGFLPMMSVGKKTEYLAQIRLKSKKDESAYNLTKIGCYPNPETSLSVSYQDENPLTAMPLFGRFKKDDLWPAYEDQICRLYRKYGKTL